MTGWTVGSLCSGVGGLDLAVEDAFDATTVWQVETDPFCQRVLAARWPHTTRHDDLTTLGAADLGPVDILTAGFPCQPVSFAGRRRAQQDERWIWPHVARLVGELGPRLVVLENVSGLLARDRGFDEVLGSLAALGYVGRWGCVRAADTGAPHRRERVFLVAWLADADRLGQRQPGGPVGQERQRAGDRRPSVADPQGEPGRQGGSATLGRLGRPAGGGVDLADAVRDRRQDGHAGGPAAGAAQRSSPPSDQAGALNPNWVEPLMGLPVGWTDPDQPTAELPGWPGWPAPPGPEQHPWEPARTTRRGQVPHRAARIRALGNAVVPQQAALALRLLTEALPA